MMTDSNKILSKPQLTSNNQLKNIKTMTQQTPKNNN